MGLKYLLFSFLIVSRFRFKYFYIILFIYSFVAVLGLHCCVGIFPLVVASSGYFLVAVLGLLTAVASLVAEHRLQACGLQ